MNHSPKQNILFRQLFDVTTSTFSYLIWDPITKEAVFIDPVLEKADRDLKLVKELSLQLKYILETHIHADHITGAVLLQKATSAKTGIGKKSTATYADLLLEDGQELSFGKIRLQAISTPGHTAGCTSYLVEDCIFTGDTLFIRGNGRTDFQGGSAEQLYSSIKEKIYCLPKETRIFPGHDYQGFAESTVEEELKWNSRIAKNTSKEGFIQTMQNLQLSPPKFLDQNVAANQKGGILSTKVDIQLEEKKASVSADTFFNLLHQIPAHQRFAIDVRTDSEFQKERIEGFNLIPVQEMENRISEIPKDKVIFLMCASGRRSKTAMQILSENQYSQQIIELNGGINDWKKNNFPTSLTTPSLTMPSVGSTLDNTCCGGFTTPNISVSSPSSHSFNENSNQKTTPRSIEEQVRLIAGGLILLSYLSSLLFPPLIFLGVTVGLGLVYAGLSGDCKMAQLLEKMSSNKK